MIHGALRFDTVPAAATLFEFAKVNDAAAATTKKKAAQASGQRTVQPPSWRRVGKRGLLFAPAMFLLMTFLEPDTTILERSFFTAQLLAIFLPFSYVMDRMTYRMWQKRAARDAAAGAPAAKSR